MRDFNREDPDINARLAEDAAYEGLLRSALTPGPGPKRRERETGWIAEHLIERNGWHLDPNDGLYRHLLTRVARGELALGRLVRSEVLLEPMQPDHLFSPAEYQADEQRRQNRKDRPPVGLMALLEAYLVEAQCKPATAKAWRSCLGDLVTYLGHDDASKVTPKDVVGWKEHLAAVDDEGAPKRGARTIRDKYLASAKAVFRWAAENHKIETNPTRGIGIRVKKRARLRDPDLTDQEAAIILSASLREARNAGQSLQAFARRWVPWLCAYTGARVGEITQLRAEDVLEIDGIACIRITPEAGTQKTERAWNVPLHPHLIEQGFFEAARSRSGPLFYDTANYRGGGLGNPQSKKVAERLARWVRSIGVDDPDVQPNHAWRHRYKTQGRLVGMDPEVRDAIQQHSRGTEASNYGHTPLPTMLREIRRLPVYDVSP